MEGINSKNIRSDLKRKMFRSLIHSADRKVGLIKNRQENIYPTLSRKKKTCPTSFCIRFFFFVFLIYKKVLVMLYDP